ncbi:hypothetical protein [Bradyrhizobium sp. UFLA05-112]
MSAAVDRFESLKRKFRHQVRSRKLSATQKHHVTTAAALQQVVEMTVAEMVTGTRHVEREVNVIRAFERVKDKP